MGEDIRQVRSQGWREACCVTAADRTSRWHDHKTIILLADCSSHANGGTCADLCAVLAVS